MYTLIELEYSLVHVYVCDMNNSVRIINILFRSAMSVIYYFKACRKLTDIYDGRRVTTGERLLMKRAPEIQTTENDHKGYPPSPIEPLFGFAHIIENHQMDMCVSTKRDESSTVVFVDK